MERTEHWQTKEQMQVSKKWMVRMVGIGVLSGAVAVSAACGGGSAESVPGGSVSHGMDPNMDMGDSPSGQQPDMVVELAMRNLRYDPGSLEVPSGKTVRINLRNMDGTEHDMQVDGLRVEKVGNAQMSGHHAGTAVGMVAMHTVANGSASIMFRTDQKGVFRFYCTLPGHKDAGMLGELKVI